MLPKIFILIGLSLCSLTSFAQQTGELFNQPIIQEKVYVHLDNNWYFAGDTIWYAAYVVRADNHHPTDMSRILYVELLNEQGYLVERQQLVVDFDGRVHGQFALNDSAWAGYYEVRAYTKWMLNFGNDILFSRVVPVYEKADSTADYRQKRIPMKVTAGDYEIQYPLPRLSIQFYPEGGHLVYGLRSRVAFEAVNELTQHIGVKGVLLEDGRELASIHCGGGGRGMFSFTPKRGSKYQARFEHQGETYVEDITRIDERGYVLRTDHDEDSLRVTVRGVDSTERQLGLCVSCRGSIITTREMSLSDEGTSVLTISTEGLPAGVNTVTLYDQASGTSIADRMVFIWRQKGEKCSVRITGKQTQLLPYEKTQLTLSLDKGNARQTFSVAVRDKKRMDESYYQGNIMTELLLQSDVRGFIAHAGQCINNPAALDLLMMVQGWNRYPWEQLFSGKAEEAMFAPEKNMMIYGEMKDLKSTVWKPKKGHKALFASLFLLNDSTYDKNLSEKTYLFKGAIYADSLDRFRINYQPFYGDAILQLRGFYAQKLEKSKKYSRILHDPHIFIRCHNFFPEDSKQYSWYEMNQPDSLLDLYAQTDDLSDSVATSILLDNVTVKQKRRKWLRVRLTQPVASYDFLDFINEQWDKGRYDENFLMDYTYEKNFHHHHFLAVNHMIGNYTMESGGIIQIAFDQMFQSPCNPIDNIVARRYSFIHRLDKITFITDSPRRAAYYQLRHQGQLCPSMPRPFYANGYVNFIQFPNKEERFVEGRYIKLHGFNRPVEFYSPDYSRMPLPEVPDHRHTLYWNPTITTDAEGRAHVEFYNNSTCTEMDVEVEGITPDGKFITNE